jgi:hypothetical protein
MAMHLACSIAMQPNLDLKTWPKQLLGYASIDIAHPVLLANIRLGWKGLTITNSLDYFATVLIMAT